MSVSSLQLRYKPLYALLTYDCVYDIIIILSQIIPTGEEIVPAVVLYAKTVLENPIKYHPLSQDEVIF